jgi:hypothetical protein
VLGYTVEEAGKFNFVAFDAALEGYLNSQGIQPKKLMSRNEFLDLIGK